MRDEQGNKIKAKSMTRRQAIPYLERMLQDLKGKKRRRAMEIAVTALEQAVGPQVSKTA